MLLAGTLAPGTYAVAQPTDKLFEDKGWEAVCQAAVSQPLPVEPARLEAQAQSETSPATPGCDEQQLYYGFGQPPAYNEALLCAYRHRASRDHNFLNGAGTLTMLYANGDAVPRNYELAIRFACESAHEGGQNIDMRLGRLEALRDGKLPSGTRFDLCDEQMSGVMGSYCEHITQKLADVSRTRKLAQLETRLPIRARTMLPALEAEESSFEKARAKGEYTACCGSGAAGFQELDQGQLREQFVINLGRFASGSLPRATPADRVKAEQMLRAALADSQGFTPRPTASSMEPTPETLATTERAWEQLFAAWMRFVPIAYPNLALNTAATELLRLRIHQLKKPGLPSS